MAPILSIHDPSLDKQFHAPATQFDVQNATESISSKLRVVILILAALTVCVGALYCLLRRPRRTTKLVIPTTPLLVFESTVSIDFDDLDDDEGTVIDVDFPEGRSSLETILSDGTPRRFTFDADKIMPFIERRKGNILDRRGITTMLCDTTAYYASEMMPMVMKSPIDRKICRPKVNFVENIASPLSPFWSKQATASSRPVFGFTSKTITPPLGSPLWSVRGSARSLVTAPMSKKGCWTP